MKHKKQLPIATQEAIQVIYKLSPYIIMIIIITLVLVKK